jgi:hypothetical protein
MALQEHAELVLAVARALYVNGQSTDRILAAAERFGQILGLRVQIILHWGELSASDIPCCLLAENLFHLCLPEQAMSLRTFAGAVLLIPPREELS